MTTSTGTGGTSTAVAAVVGEHALRTLLDDRELDAALAQGGGGRARLAHADGGLALVLVADRDGDVLERLLDPLRASSREAQNIGR